MDDDGDQETTKKEDEGEPIAFLMRARDLDSMAEIGGDRREPTVLILKIGYMVLGTVVDLGHKAVKVVGMATGYERVKFLADLERWTESSVHDRGRRWFWSER
ncbi:hypothetical protein SESBI_13443 [Sesbania bispinosa]|nr:hypothetical protein SESBI_13443 [Sesbania bispinosa]